MEFPNKPWFKTLDVPTPAWATHQIDFTNSEPHSYSVWIGRGIYQYFRGTEPIGVWDEPEGDDERFGAKEWERELKSSCSYVKVIDLQPIEENE